MKTNADSPNGPTRLLLYPLLLGMMAGVGFFVGRAFTSAAADPTVAYTSSTRPGETAPAQREVAAAVPPATETPRSDLSAEERHTIDLFQRATPSVVYITSIVQQRDFFTMNVTRIPSGTGSGFVWDREGHVVTNYHVLARAREWQVTIADGTTWNAELVGVAPEKDLAVLRIDAPAEQLFPLALGRSHNLLVGQSVLAIGNPFGLDQAYRKSYRKSLFGSARPRGA